MRPHAAHLPAKILRAELLERRPDAEVEVLDCLALAGGLVERAINGASYESDFANRLFDVERRHSMTPAPADAVKVMTRNLFLGADLRPVSLALADPERLAEVPGVVAAIFNPGEPPGVVQRTDFARRAIAIAREIEATRPDLIGLQEAAVWRTREPVAAVPTIVADHLEILEAELARRGLAYRRAAVVTNGEVELPSAAGLGVGLTDRGAILARSELLLSNARAGNFANVLQVRTAQGAFPFKRGWASVDVDLPGGAVRFVTTHLEVRSPAQELQLEELLAGPADTALPVVLVGDFNARTGSATYERARAAGFADAWTAAHPHGPPGPTCCHRLPLADPRDELQSRIDHILTRGLDVSGAVTVGARPVDFVAGLWPSDHAGVVANARRARALCSGL